MGITGGKLGGASLESHTDHRLAMAWAIAGLAAIGEVNIAGAEAVDVSYPGFWETIESL
jgi:3-phosphoshikimate 1-carboxyvinyltransferase